MFALVDCNNFYASCERVFRPDLNGRPIVVLSNNDGCVIARSNEAKAAGIPMGAPAFEYEEVFRTHGVEVFSANFALYGDMSQRVMTLLSEFCPDTEVYSIDEVFLKMEGYEHFNLYETGIAMRKRVLRCTGLPVSVGFAPTKALAKLANRIAKKYPEKTGGVYIIDSDKKRDKALRWLKVEDIWGVGRQHTRRLHAMNVRNAYDFTQLSESWIKKNMAIVGLRLQQDLRGIPTLDLEQLHTKKNIATTRSFEQNYTELSQMRERVSSFAVSCAEKLRKQHSCCNSLMVFIHTNGHRQDLPQYSRNIVVQLPYPSQSAIEISQAATDALERIFKPGFAYKKAGVIVMDFTPELNTQLSLFRNSDPRHRPLMKAMDQLNTLYGQQKVRLASQDLQRLWKMKQEKLSPRYTTRLSDIITIHA